MATRELGTAPSRTSDAATKAYVDTASAPAYITTVGDGTSGPFVITHNLNTRHVRVIVYRNASPWEEVFVRVEHTSKDTVTLLPDETWTTAQYRVLVQFVAASDTTAPTAGVLSYSSADSTSITYTFTGGSDNVGVAAVDAYDAASNTLLAAGITSPWTRTGLNPSTSYGTYLKYRDIEGNASQSNTDTHSTTAVPDTTAPTAGTLTLSSSTTTTITYTFTSGSDDVGVVGVDAYDATTNTLIASNITSPWVRGSGSGSNAPLTPSTNYGTYLKYRDAAGNASQSNTVSTTTGATPDTTAPTAGTASYSGTKTSTSITYTFTAGSDNVGIAGVDAYNAADNSLLAANVTSPWTRSGLSPSTSYGTFFRYRDAAGNFTDSNTVTQSTNAASTAPSFVDAKGEKTTSSLSTMPTHQTGDYLFMWAYRDGFVTAPSIPAGWTQIIVEGQNSNVLLVCYKIVASAAEVSGTWTNATNLTCASYRNVGSIGASAIGGGTSATITIPALTLQNTSGSSLVIAGGGHRSGANSLATPPAGLTYRAGYEGGGTEQDTAVYDTNGGVSSFTGGTINYATTSGWEMAAIELKAA